MARSQIALFAVLAVLASPFSGVAGVYAPSSGGGGGGGGAPPGGVSGDLQTNNGSGGFGALTPGSGIATWLAAPSSANLAAALTTKTGTGAAVFATAPILTTPNLGIPSMIDLTNATNLPAGQLTGTVSVNRFNSGTDADATHFLRGDGTWAVPPGGSASPGGSGGELQYNNAGAFGAASVGTGLDMSGGTLSLVMVPNAQSGAGYTVVAGDANKTVRMTNAGATTVNLTAAATLGANFGFYLECDAGCTVDPAGAETVNGASTLVLAAHQKAEVSTDGTVWRAGLLPAVDPSNGANLAAGTVANASLAAMNAHTFKGNNTGSAAAPSDLTATQLTAELNTVVGDSGSGGTKGLVPAPAAGDAAAGKFMKADGTWSVPPGGGGSPGGSSGDIQYNNAGAFGGRAPSGNGTTVVTTTGTHTSGHCAQWDASGNAIDSGAGCGGGSPKAILQFTGTGLGGSTPFLGAGPGSTHLTARAVPIPFAGTLSNLACRSTAVPGAGVTWTFTLSRAVGNGTAADQSGQVATIVNADVSSTRSANTGVSVADGDNVTIHFTFSSGTPSASVACTMQLS